MGETGCGKTRLIKFLCALQMPSSQESETMILMKVRMENKLCDQSCILYLLTLLDRNYTLMMNLFSCQNSNIISDDCELWSVKSI